MRRTAALLALIPFLSTLPGTVGRETLVRPAPRPDDGDAREHEREGEAGRAGAWWQLQRAYPGADIPPGAFARGRETVRALRLKRPHMPGPMPPPWTPIGPAPIDTTTSLAETPNMGPEAGRASAIAVDPTDSKTIYAGFGLGGVWKTIDGGVTWAPLMDFEPTLAVGAIAIDAAAPGTLYVGTGEPAPYLGYSGEGIFKSTDGGKTFAKIGGATLDGLTIARIFLDGAAGQMYATAFYGALGRGQICNFDADAMGQGLYRSSDGGATWKQILAGEVIDLEVDVSVMPRRLFVGEFGQGALRSDDGGVTWAAPTGLPAKMSRVELTLSPVNPSIVYAGMGVANAAQIYVSQDGGKSFSPMSGAPDYCQAQCYYDNAVAVDPQDPKTLYVGGSLCGVWKTSNATDPAPTWVNVSLQGQDCGGGTNWAVGYVHPDVHAIAFDPSAPGTVFAATDGGVSRSLDGGATWAQLNAGVGTIQMYALCADPKDPLKLYGGAQDNGSFMRMGTSLTWRGLISGDGGPCAVDPKNPMLVLGSGDSASLFRTTNGFKGMPAFVFNTNPAVCQAGDPGCGDRVSFIAPLVGDPSTSGTFYVGTSAVYKSTAGGAVSTWKAVSPDLTAGAMSVTCPNASAFPPLDDALTVIAVAPSAPGTLYTGSQSGRISITVDGGGTWKRIDKAPLPGRWVSAIAVDPRDPLTVFAAFSGFDAATPKTPGHVFRSSDGGQTWQPRDIGVDVPVDTLLAHPVGSDLLYAGTDAGVLVTLDGGQSWLPFDDGLPQAAVYALVFHRAAGALVAGTFGRSAWERTFTPGALGAAPAMLTFTAEVGGAAPAAQPVQVSNGDVYGSIVSFTVTSGAPWLTVDVSAADAAGATPVTVNASADPTQVTTGTFDTALTIAPTGGGAPLTVPVHFTVTTPPPPPPPKKKSGCGCRIPSEPEAGAGAAAIVLVAALALARRRRCGDRARSVC
jgi:MYXO-CTERM domain-containing protein